MPFFSLPFLFTCKHGFLDICENLNIKLTLRFIIYTEILSFSDQRIYPYFSFSFLFFSFAFTHKTRDIRYGAKLSRGSFARKKSCTVDKTAKIK